MEISLASYLPLITSIISLATAVIVIFIGRRISRSAEADKVRISYINYALQKFMDEYVNYDPVIDLSGKPENRYIRVFESKFKECRAAITRITPLVDEKDLVRLNEIDKNYSEIIRNQYNEQLSGKAPSKVDGGEYTRMLDEYNNIGHNLLKSNIRILRSRLEKGGTHQD